MTQVNNNRGGDADFFALPTTDPTKTLVGGL